MLEAAGTPLTTDEAIWAKMETIKTKLSELKTTQKESLDLAKKVTKALEKRLATLQDLPHFIGRLRAQ